MNLGTKKVLITGGSAGIGKSLIAGLAARGVQHMAVMGRPRQGLPTAPAAAQ